MPYPSDAQRRAVWASRRREEHKLDEKWNKEIIQAPDRTLTRLQVFNYYSDPKIRRELLSVLKDRPLLAIQTILPKDQIVRRHRAPGEPIRISQAERDPGHVNDLAWYTERRFSEFHPVIGKSTKEIWVDLDPGKQVCPSELKSVVKKIDDEMQKIPGVHKTQIAYSGGRGYYVRGFLHEEKDTDSMRKTLEKTLKPLVSEDKKLTLHPPESNQIRLDISTLHDKGSIRAPYSLNASTGFASVPVDRKNLDVFDPSKDANPTRMAQGNYMPKRAAEEFAPGIPKSKETHPLPELSGGNWTMAVQEHKAKRAGKHWDLRLVDPMTGRAHSWAIPKYHLPDIGERPILAIRTPTHTSDYALTFGIAGPQAIGHGYGAGTVQMARKEQVKIVSSSPDKIKFETHGKDPERFVLFHTRGNSWMMKNLGKTGDPMVKSAFESGWDSIFRKFGASQGVQPQPTSSETLEPMETNDEELPAGQLARALAQLDTPNQRDDSDAYRNNAEERMNKPTNWTTPVTVPYSYGVGPAPIITGAT